jgi:hypothetical protein
MEPNSLDYTRVSPATPTPIHEAYPDAHCEPVMGDTSLVNPTKDIVPVLPTAVLHLLDLYIIPALATCTKDQLDLIKVFWCLGIPFAANSEIYSEYRNQHPHDADPVKNRDNRIRNVLQRNCETSKRFKDGDGRKIFRTPTRGFWGLTPAYYILAAASSIRATDHGLQLAATG